MLRPETGTLRLGTADAPFSVAELPEGEDVELRIYIDKYVVEVFANGRQAMVTMHDGELADLRGFTVGAPTTLASVDIWQLEATNQGFLEAQRSRNWVPDTE